MTDIDILDAAILRHMQEHPQVSPGRSPDVRRLAAAADYKCISRDQLRVIELRMKALRDAARYRWCPLGKRYEVNHA